MAPCDPGSDRAEGCACCADEAAQERIARQSRMLRELAQIGMNLSAALQQLAQQAVAQVAGADPPSAAALAGAGAVVGDLSLAHTRVARAVRQTLALETRLNQDREARLRKAQQEQDERRAELDKRRSDRQIGLRITKDHVGDIVDRVIDAEAPESDVERLQDALDERLADDKDDEFFRDRPIGEMVALICRDLGLSPDWSLLQGEDWAIAEARTRPPGSPFATPRARGPDPGEPWADDDDSDGDDPDGVWRDDWPAPSRTAAGRGHPP